MQVKTDLLADISQTSISWWKTSRVSELGEVTVPEALQQN